MSIILSTSIYLNTSIILSTSIYLNTSIILSTSIDLDTMTTWVSQLKFSSTSDSHV